MFVSLPHGGISDPNATYLNSDPLTYIRLIFLIAGEPAAVQLTNFLATTQVNNFSCGRG
jgi:hypothetical protein